VWRAGRTPLAAAPRAFFPPEVAIHVVRLACERPDVLGRRLSPWAGHELARQRIAEGSVADISASTVRRMLAVHQLKPWRHQLWRHPQQPRDAPFSATIMELLDLYTRPLRDDALVRSVDEKTALQPRPRRAPTLPAQPQNMPNRHEQEPKRAGALNRLAAFDPRSGQVYGHGYARKRQQACMAVRDAVDQEIAAHIRTLPLVGDHVRTHQGKELTRWFAKPPRFVVHFTPVHCSWMNHVAQWFRILPRKRLRLADVTAKDHLRAKLDPCICAWNEQAHPFNWSTKSVAKVMAEAPALAA
jgi:DDE superfamily endonuclease